MVENLQMGVNIAFDIFFSISTKQSYNQEKINKCLKKYSLVK
jgi:hypothetical protein